MKLPAERRLELERKWKEWPCVKTLELELNYLFLTEVKVSMPGKENFVNGENVLPGFVVAMPANVAGVFLAMMNSDGFTPLVSAEIQWLRPVIFGKDNKIIAFAAPLQVSKHLIRTEVKLENEKQELKAKGTLTFFKR